MIKAVLFDLDGTLIDTARDFIRIIQNMCRQRGIAPLDEDVIRSQVSAGARAMVHLVYPELAIDDPNFLALRQEFLDEYERNIVVDTALFEGMESLLQELESQQIPWGIVTNKPRYLSELLLQSLGLTARCAVLVCPEDVKQAKPDPEPMYLAANQLQIEPQHIIYVGDHPRDIDAGNAADMPTILAAYGYLPPDAQSNLEDWHADYIVNDVNQLQQCIQRLITA